LFHRQNSLVSELLSYYQGLNLMFSADHEYHEEVEPLIKLSQKKILGDVSELAINSAHGLAFHHGLGAPLYPTSSSPLNKYVSSSSVAQFAQSAWSKPNIAVVANGASQAELSKWVGEFFTATPSAAAAISGPATKYYGGEERSLSLSQVQARSLQATHTSLRLLSFLRFLVANRASSGPLDSQSFQRLRHLSLAPALPPLTLLTLMPDY
jgi:hypothetical protein